jgi:hypothetical protein
MLLISMLISISYLPALSLEEQVSQPPSVMFDDGLSKIDRVEVATHVLTQALRAL